MNVTYLINSHVHYAAPRQRLLATMKGVANHRKLVMVAGADRSGVECLDGVWHLHVEHNSFDYTGLIEILSNLSACEWVFPLQDTMEFGPESDRLIQSADPNQWATAAFGGQCNLVLYRMDYLAMQASFVLSMKNCSKLRSVEMEGELWKRCPVRASFPNSAIKLMGRGTPYGTADRVKEHYMGVDIVKWKANWGQNMEAMVTRP